MLQVEKNKKLTIKESLKRELRNLPQIEVDKATYMMESFIKTNKIETIGPLITVTHDSVIDKKEGLLVNIDLIMQVKSVPSIIEPYQYIPSGLSVSHCIYIYDLRDIFKNYPTAILNWTCTYGRINLLNPVQYTPFMQIWKILRMLQWISLFL